MTSVLICLISGLKQKQYPDWWINASGVAYVTEPGEALMNDITNKSKQPLLSVLIVREQQHHKNLSGGKETFVPRRLLFGVIPHALSDAYRFWQDESICPRGTSLDEFDLASRGYKRLLGYPKSDDLEYMLVVEFVSTGDWSDGNSSFSAPVGSGGIVNHPHVHQCTGFPGRSVRVFRYPKADFEADFHRRQRIARVLETTQLLVTEIREKKKVKVEDVDADALVFKIDQEVECDHEGKGTFWPCIVRRVNDNGTYDLEYIKDYKFLGIQRGIYPDLIQKRGENDKKKSGEGIWRFEGMSESDEDDRRGEATDDEAADDTHDKEDKSKNRLCFYHFDELNVLLRAANDDEELCVEVIKRLAAVPGVQPFFDIHKLARAVANHVQANSEPTSPSTHHRRRKAQSSDVMVLLNLLYAPRRSRLFSILRTLTRIENASHICAWTKLTSLKVLVN
jgi:hypothetical protein